MQPIGLGNTRILTNYAQKSPRTMKHEIHEFNLGVWMKVERVDGTANSEDSRASLNIELRTAPTP